MPAEQAGAARTVTVAIAPDAPVVTEGTAAMVSRAAPEFEVVCLVDLNEDRSAVDIFLYDPELHALADLARVRRASPLALVVAYCWSTRPSVVASAQDEGAVAFLSKQLSGDEVVAAVRALHVGNRDPFLVLPRTMAVAAAPQSRPHGLSERELEVVQLIVRGYSNEEIAHRLFLSINSVKTYIRSAYRKIGATRRTQAVLWGVQQGLSSHDEDSA